MHHTAAAATAVVFDDDFIEYQRALRAESLELAELLRYSTLFPGTPIGVRAELLLRLPIVTEVAFTMTAPLKADVQLELPAWSWLALGLVHLVLWRLARRILRSSAPTFVATRIRMVLRGAPRPAALAPAAARASTRVI